ncbi:TetR/AcrR family transcriptional regulator [uncultured Microbacterium sp.]|uniref:TetR/AcrR family transcriptional regulator n=1 Tax=uncultured Microbacterium sp. TaxID=191216 RepID=UPI0025F03D59|nr:TetR/AcrR family transcriptional regulator [uncultured Microbacterium sp.]
MTIGATRSRENTRARLLDAAAQVFAEEGLDGATVEAVCERAGFTRGAFYSNFASKDELFLELAGAVSAERLGAVRERIDELTASGALAADCDPTTLVQQVMDTGTDDRLGVMLLSEIRLRAVRDPVWGAAYLAQEQEMVDGIARIIEDVVSTGSMSLRVEAPLAARMLLILWEGMTVRGAMAGQDDAQLRRTGSVELGRAVSLLLG